MNSILGFFTGWWSFLTYPTLLLVGLVILSATAPKAYERIIDLTADILGPMAKKLSEVSASWLGDISNIARVAIKDIADTWQTMIFVMLLVSTAWVASGLRYKLGAELAGAPSVEQCQATVDALRKKFRFVPR